MTKVTGESVKAALAYFDEHCFLHLGGDFSDPFDAHLYVLASLSRRVIEPGEEELVRAQKAMAESIIAGHVDGHAPLEGKLAAVEPQHVRAVLAAISTGDAD